MLHSPKSTARYDEIMKKAEGATHILWATGGSLMPEEIRLELLGKACCRRDPPGAAGKGLMMQALHNLYTKWIDSIFFFC